MGEPSRVKRKGFDRAKLEKLKGAYRKALAAKEEMFTFEGDEYLVTYAKYLIEYLENVLI